MTWQPRYLAYCKLHGITPGDDRDMFYNFSLWINQQMMEAAKAGHPCIAGDANSFDMRIVSQILWDEWLCREGATKLKLRDS